MDARITKQRLGNMLSYDWIKILVVIAAAIFGLSVLFTMVRTRPEQGQEYTVHFFGGLSMGEDIARFGDDLEDIFSYDILETGTESFTNTSESRQAYSLRRSVLEGTAVFAADFTTSEEEGAVTPFGEICMNGLLDGGTTVERMGMFLDPEQLFSDTEAYLARFFGEDWETGEPDEGVIRTYFLGRCGKDKRFRTDAQKETGVQWEKERLLAIRTDYLAVRAAFESGLLTLKTYDSPTLVSNESGEKHPLATYKVGFGMGKLPGIGKLCNYSDGEGAATQELVLLLYDNGAYSEHAKYENFTLIKYLLDRYA